ncbi:44326_t:CDS:2, partial [Gigaspora margarita]
YHNLKAMLVLGSFSAHITDRIKAGLHLENTDLAVIPRVSLDRNLKHANLNTVSYWVLNAISNDIIVQAFKKCSIFNCLSENKDHLIYEDSKDKDNEFDENATESDEDKKYNKLPNKDEKSSEGEKSDEDKESDKDENIDKYNR